MRDIQLTTKEEAAGQWFFWLAIGGVIAALAFSPVLLVLCIPFLAFICTRRNNGETQ